jgi:peptide/nickel transport system substrate-binding protein
MVAVLLCAFAVWVVGPATAETPKRGGTLTYVVPAEPPSYDGHRETTFALIHPIAPFYSTLIRVNPDNPSSPTDFVGDLALEVPEPTDDGKKYTFKIHQNATFWDGQPLTSADVVATFKKIVSPPSGVGSARQPMFSMVDKVSATDDYTVVFDLKYPSAAFIPSLANPYNFIYSAKKLAEDMHWYEKNVLGSGPFMFVQAQPGAFIEGKRNPNYFRKGLPYLDGFRAIFAKKQSLRVQAIRGGRALIEFRGFPPKSRDDLKNALGDQITVQESVWNCNIAATANHKKKPFDDPRVRRALSLAADRWGGSEYLSKIAIVKTVGSIVYPGHPLAPTTEELQQIAGYWPDLKKSRAEARRLLREAGVPEGFKFKLHNRAIDQPYKLVGTWLVDQWRQIGLNVEQWVEPTGPWYKTRRSGTFQVGLDPNCQSVVNPLLDVAKYTSSAPQNYGQYQDPILDDWYDRMNRTLDFAEQRRLMQQFVKRVADDEGHTMMLMWWYRIIPHRSEVRGWKISPSHYLNQDLANVWLAK